MGTYVAETNTIRIDSKLSLKEKISTIIHEFGHYLIYTLGLSDETNYVFDIVCVFFDIRNKKKRIKLFKWLTNYYF